MDLVVPPLTPAQASLDLTLGGRADSRASHPFLGDTTARRSGEKVRFRLLPVSDAVKFGHRHSTAGAFRGGDPDRR